MLLGNSHHTGADALHRGLTLIEITVVIVVLMTLVGMSMFAVGGYKDWKLGEDAAGELRRVYNAQRTYLAEHPTETPSSLTAAKVVPYLSNGATSLPTVEAVDGTQLNVKVDVVPPVVVDGSGSTYDPSGKPDDGQWDVGR